MGWTAPATWTTGQVPTAANFNQQIRDNLNAAGNHEGWSTYAPVLTGSGSNPNPSAKAAHYLRVGNLVVYAYVFTCGTTVGSGTYSVSLPVNGNFVAHAFPGNGYLYDASGYDGRTFVHYTAASTDLATVTMITSTGGTVAHNAPFTFAVNDQIGGWMMYRAAT